MPEKLGRPNCTFWARRTSYFMWSSALRPLKRSARSSDGEGATESTGTAGGNIADDVTDCHIHISRSAYFDYCLYVVVTDEETLHGRGEWWIW